MKKFVSIDKNFIIILLFSFIFGVGVSVSIQLKNNIFALDWKGIFVAFLSCFFLIYFLLYLVDSYFKKKSIHFDAIPLSFKGMWILFLIGYGICFLTYFPGVGMNDGLNILKYGMSTVYQFPVVYCIFVGILTLIGRYFGSLQISIALYSMIQVVIVTYMTTYLCFWVNNKKIPGILKMVTFIYFLFSPILAMYSISMLRDTVFSLSLILLCIKGYDLFFDTIDLNWKYWLSFLILCLLVIGLRNNGKFIVIPFLLVCFVKKRSYWKKWLLIAVASFCMLGCIQGVMNHYGTKQMFQEEVGIPLQQMCAVVVNNGNMTATEKNFMNHLMRIENIKKNYNPYTVDPIKWNGNNQFNRMYLENHRMEFLKNWFSMMPKNFGIYVKAYLQQTYWFWAPWQEGQVQCYFSIETYSNNAWLPGFVKENGIHDQSLMPEPIRTFLKSYYQWGRNFFREGILFWMLALSSLILILTKQSKKIIVYLPLFLLWFTLMISTPVSQSLRYVFAFVYGLPLFAIIPLIKDEYLSYNCKK